MVLSSDVMAERGGIFFWILLSITLIALLTSVVSRGSRVAESSLSRDQARLIATETLEYSNAVASGIQKLLLRGCTINQISFVSPLAPQNYTNPNAPTDERCNLFSINGGGMNFVHPPHHGREWFFGVHVSYDGLDDPSNPANTELTLYLREIDASVCRAINEMIEMERYLTVDINIPFEEAPNGYYWDVARGTFGTSGNFGILVNESGTIIQSTPPDQGCFRNLPLVDQIHYFRVLYIN